MGVMWNTWHGCIKKSEGCQNCYVYRGDSKYGRDSSQVALNSNFDLPVKRDKYGNYKHKSGTMFWLCFTSDFLIEEADEWRKRAWEIIAERHDCNFFFITKRIERLSAVLPPDWEDGYDNVIIGVTAENQKRVEERMPIFLELPLKHRVFIHEPLLENLNILEYLSDKVEQVVAGGESGYSARDCYYDWILNIRKQCLQKNVSFYFKQTGTHFVKNGKRYTLERKLHHAQARKADINFVGLHNGYLTRD